MQLWAEVYEQIITALFFFEIIMIALLAIKKSFAAILVSTLASFPSGALVPHKRSCCQEGLRPVRTPIPQPYSAQEPPD